MKHFISIIVLQLCIYLNVISTDLPTIPNSPRSPEVASFTRYMEMPISLYTGNVDISIPIYTLEIDDIKLPIILSYHNAGVKVEEEASWVGLGWNLTVGGCITRKLCGFPDDYTGGWQNQTNNEIIDYPTDYIGDRQGYFFIKNIKYYNDKYTDEGYPYPLFTDPRVELQYSMDNIGIDHEPDQYHYNVPGYSGNFTYDKTGVLAKGELNDLLIQKSGTNSEYWKITDPSGNIYEFKNMQYSYVVRDYYNQYISAWFLSKITTYKGKTINFVYDTPNKKVIGTSMYSEVYDALKYEFVTRSETENEFTPVYLKQITTSQGVTINFSISSGRRDIENGYKLDAINIINTKNNYVKKYIFNYNYYVAPSDNITVTNFKSNHKRYFNSLQYNGSYTDNQAFDTAMIRSRYRLKLNGLKEVSITNDNDFSEYNFNYNSIQLPVKYSNAVDHYGYYNGIANTTKLPTFSDYVSITYEDQIQTSNEFVVFIKANRQSDPLKGKACMLEQITYPTKGTLTIEYEINQFTNVNDFEPYSYDAVKNPIKRTIGTGGGYRVKKITNYDPITNKSIVRNFSYSNGLLITIPRYSTIIKDYFISSSSSLCGTYSCRLPITRIYISSCSNAVSSNCYAGSHVGYTNVTENVTDGSREYKTLYTYNNIKDVSISGENLLSVPSYANSGSGLLISKIDYNENNTIVHKIEKSYSHLETQNNYGIKHRYCRMPQGYKEEKNWESIYAYYHLYFYKIMGQLDELYKETEYKDGVTVTKNYFYDNPKHYNVSRIETINSKGETLKTVIKYPLDYTSQNNPTALQIMRNKNMINYKIEQQEWNGSNLIGSTFNEYYNFGSQVPLLKNIYNVETATPLSSSTFKGLDAYGYLLSGTHYISKMNINYDNSTLNPITTQKTGDISTVYYWGYNNTLPVVKALNTTSSALKTSVTNALTTAGISDISTITTITSLNKTTLNNFNTALRNALPNAMITTYTYFPLFGLTSETDEKGLTKYYEYDSFGRLLYVRDQDFKIINEYRYNYKK